MLTRSDGTPLHVHQLQHAERMHGVHYHCHLPLRHINLVTSTLASPFRQYTQLLNLKLMSKRAAFMFVLM